MQTLARLGAVAGAVTLVFAGMAPAQAARYTHTDPTADVVLQECPDAECAEPTFTPAPTRTEGDITALTINHGLDNVVLKATFKALTRNSQRRLFVTRIVTNEGYSRLAQVYFDGDVPNGVAYLTNNGNDIVKCTVSKSVDFTAETIQVSVPRTCLSTPYWIRGGAQYGRWVTDLSLYVDDAFTTGTAPYYPVLGQQVKRG